MKTSISLLSAFILSMAIPPLSHAKSYQLTKFQKLIAFAREDMRASGAVGLAIVIIEDGKITHATGLGEEISGTGKSITTNSLFELQSFTKTVTAATALELVRQKKLNLMAPVNQYVPEFQIPPPWRSETIKVRDLLMMTSGIVSDATTIPNFDQLPFNDQTPSALSEYIKILSRDPLMYPPGLIFNYSNATYGLLGLIVERASHASYSQAVANNILRPAGMKDATFQKMIAASKSHAWVHGRDIDGKVISKDTFLGKESYYHRPWGGLFGSIMDIGHFGEFLLRHRITFLTKDSILKSQADQYYGYGIHFQRNAFEGNRLKENILAWAAGDGPGIGASSTGFKSNLYFVPEKKFAIGLITNDGNYNYKNVTSKAFEIFLDLKRSPSKLVKTDPTTWVVYEGIYEGPANIGEMIVTLENKKLMLQIPKLDFQTELIQYDGSNYIWADLPKSWLEQYHMTAEAYRKNPLMASSFRNRPGSNSPQTELFVTRIFAGIRK